MGTPPIEHGGNVIDTLPILHLAALGGKPHAIKALLKISTKKSSKIDHALDSDGNTTLLYAFQHSLFEDDSEHSNIVNMLNVLTFYKHQNAKFEKLWSNHLLPRSTLASRPRHGSIRKQGWRNPSNWATYT